MELKLTNAAQAATKENIRQKAEVSKATDDMDNAELFAKFVKKAEEVAQAAV